MKSWRLSKNCASMIKFVSDDRTYALIKFGGNPVRNDIVIVGTRQNVSL